jgi:hypothetical protein
MHVRTCILYMCVHVYAHVVYIHVCIQLVQAKKASTYYNIMYDITRGHESSKEYG